MLETTEFETGALSPYYRNPRMGDVERVKASLAERGQYRPIVVNIGTHTGRPMEILAGNHTWKAAVALGWATIEATTVDVTEREAAGIVAVDNRSADAGTNDLREVVALLEDVAPDELAGVGFSPTELAEVKKTIEGATDDDWAAALGVLPGEGEEQERFTKSFTLTDAQHRDILAAVQFIGGEDAQIKDGAALAAVAREALEVL